MYYNWNMQTSLAGMWRRVWQFLLKLNIRSLNLSPRYLPIKLKMQVCAKTSTQMLIVDLLIIVKIYREAKHPSTGKYIDK